MIFGTFSHPLCRGVVNLFIRGGRVVAKVVGGSINCIDEEGYDSEFVFRANVKVAEQESVQVSVLCWREVQHTCQQLLGESAATIVFDGIFGSSSASKQAPIRRGCAMLVSSMGAPAVPECAEDCCTHPWWNQSRQQLKVSKGPSGLPGWSVLPARSVHRHGVFGRVL